MKNSLYLIVEPELPKVNKFESEKSETTKRKELKS